MDSRVNVEADRLSKLPDDLIHKILSSINIKVAIELSALSPRWRFVWTTLPYLNFATASFSTLPKFAKFVRNVMSHRNSCAKVYSVKLSFRGKQNQAKVGRILNYVLYHNIQQLNVVCLHKYSSIEFPLSLFGSQLEHLGFEKQIGLGFTSSLDFPTLTTLDLRSVTLCDDNADKCDVLFSKCTNLKNLSLKQFNVKGSSGFSISHPGLSNLTLEYNHDNVTGVNVAAPQLKNLTIRSCTAEVVISAPYLASLFFEGSSLKLRVSTEGFNSLEKAHIFVRYPIHDFVHRDVSLLQQLRSVKFLTLSLEIVEFLSSYVELDLPHPSPFVNLKSLKIYPIRVSLWDLSGLKNVEMSTKLKSYLLDGSPGCTFTMILREEIVARNLMAETRALLDMEKDKLKTKEAPLPKKPKIGENMARINNCWTDLFHQIHVRKVDADAIIPKLQSIDELLTRLPPSVRDKLQPGFAGLCAEASIALGKITDYVKIKCDENQSRLSLYFHELATALERPYTRGE